MLEEWFFHHFMPEVKLYCWRNGIPFKILLVLGNASGHPPTWMIFILMFKLYTCCQIQLHFCSQWTKASSRTSQTYRMDLKTVDTDPEMTLHDYWKSYNILNCIKNIDAAWREVSEVNLNAMWRPLCLQFVNKFKGFNQEEKTKYILTSLVRLSKKLNLDLERRTLRNCWIFMERS